MRSPVSSWQRGNLNNFIFSSIRRISFVVVLTRFSLKAFFRVECRIYFFVLWRYLIRLRIFFGVGRSFLTVCPSSMPYLIAKVRFKDAGDNYVVIKFLVSLAKWMELTCHNPKHLLTIILYPLLPTSYVKDASVLPIMTLPFTKLAPVFPVYKIGACCVHFNPYRFLNWRLLDAKLTVSCYHFWFKRSKVDDGTGWGQFKQFHNGNWNR